MYSYADRLKAVDLYIKHDLSVAAVVHELGYPSRNMLRQWHQEYTETGGLHEKHGKKPKYTFEQKKAVIDYYLAHGRSIRDVAHSVLTRQSRICIRRQNVFLQRTRYLKKQRGTFRSR